jgi:hypothetical protein
VAEASVPKNPVPKLPVPKNRESKNHVKMKGDDVMSRDQHLQEIEAQYGIIRDRLRSVCERYSTGFYLYGPPGVSKTHTVREFFKSESVGHKYVRGHLTGSGLFDILEENPDGVIVLDDVSKIFKRDDKGVQVLLAALGAPPAGSRGRRVSYRTARGEREVKFTGGVVAISNLGIDEHGNDVIEALADRVHIQKFDPTPEQVEAMIYKIAQESPAAVTAEDAVIVADFLVRTCRERGIRLTIRMFVEKALPVFRMWKDKRSETHWEVLVRVDVDREFVPQRHAVRETLRSNSMDADRRIVLAICKQFSDPYERARAWKEQKEAARRDSTVDHKNLKDSG